MRVTLIKSFVHMVLVAVAVIAVFWFGFLWSGQAKDHEIKILPSYPVKLKELAKFYDDPLAPVPQRANYE